MKLKYDWRKGTAVTFLKELIDKGFLTTNKIDIHIIL
ncbi:hypothetical protein ACTPDI_07685 [Clostridioides difficile]